MTKPKKKPKKEAKKLSPLEKLKKEHPEKYKRYLAFRKARKEGRPTAASALFEAKVHEGIRQLQKTYPKSLKAEEAEFIANYYFGLPHRPPTEYLATAPSWLTKSAHEVMREKGYRNLSDFAKLYMEFRRSPKFKEESLAKFARFLTKKFGLEEILDFVVFSTTAWHDMYGTRVIRDQALPHLTFEAEAHFKRFERERALHSPEAENFFISRLKETSKNYGVRTIEEMQELMIEEIEDHESIYEAGGAKDVLEFYQRMMPYLMTLTARHWRRIGLEPPKRRKK